MTEENKTIDIIWDHIDHGLSAAHMTLAEETALEVIPDGFFLVTIRIPVLIGDLPCGLYGPICGDDPIRGPEWDVSWEIRGDRKYASRMLVAPMRDSKIMTIIGMNRRDMGIIDIFTAYGGPPAPKGLFDREITYDEIEKSIQFWAVHALAKG